MHGEESAAGPGKATAAGEDGRNSSPVPAACQQALDPIKALIAQLEAAAGGCGAVPLRDGGTVQVRPVAGGFALSRRL